ncbi:unnamed protein product (macronuclear) [Paramecium tetraurelia]|uniref:Uncharacterized protein n=1 Tax=Paramecium tetraurelia TaxID=5888 RepID=A0BY57_PARTE|nr:uncharacterized protein GSPATT00033327001 [Paramecium tetraurelia]CAK63474.1 unnamed protein product [Paramecium tetraurelia]|eukprot:XP_001430872.1 hypothetical protein (macronuclear) [Paramecium tetraurelia strain d4-2]
MNIQDNLELLNHQLNVSNNKLLLQVEVLSQQNNLLNKKLEEQQHITNQIQYLQNENNQLKQDILILQESLFNLKNEKYNDIEQSYSSMLLVQSKENEKELSYLKQEYKDHIFKLQQEKNQFFEQAVSIGIQNQTAKNLELQTTKIIQIAQKLEKIICESQYNQENKIEKAKTAREIYDNLITQLNTDLNKNQKEYEKNDKFNHTQTSTKNFSSAKYKDKPINLTRLLSLTKTNETPKSQAYLNGLSLQIVNKNN